MTRDGAPYRELPFILLSVQLKHFRHTQGTFNPTLPIQNQIGQSKISIPHPLSMAAPPQKTLKDLSGSWVMVCPPFLPLPLLRNQIPHMQ